MIEYLIFLLRYAHATADFCVALFAIMYEKYKINNVNKGHNYHHTTNLDEETMDDA